MATDDKALDEVQIRHHIEDQIKAIRAKDIDGATSSYAPDVRSFDVVNPLQYIGSDAIRERLEAWFASFAGALGYELRDLSITVGDTAAFCHRLNPMSAPLRQMAETRYVVARNRLLPQDRRDVENHASASLRAFRRGERPSVA